MRLIQWHDGQYGVIKGIFLRRAVGDDGYRWFGKEYWPKYCKFKTKEEALAVAKVNHYKVLKWLN